MNLKHEVHVKNDVIGKNITTLFTAIGAREKLM